MRKCRPGRVRSGASRAPRASPPQNQRRLARCAELPMCPGACWGDAGAETPLTQKDLGEPGSSLDRDTAKEQSRIVGDSVTCGLDARGQKGTSARRFATWRHEEHAVGWPLPCGNKRIYGLTPRTPRTIGQLAVGQHADRVAARAAEKPRDALSFSVVAVGVAPVGTVMVNRVMGVYGTRRAVPFITGSTNLHSTERQNQTSQRGKSTITTLGSHLVPSVPARSARLHSGNQMGQRSAKPEPANPSQTLRGPRTSEHETTRR